MKKIVLFFFLNSIFLWSPIHSDPVYNRERENDWAAPMSPPRDDEILVIDSAMHLRYDAALLRKALSQYHASFEKFLQYQEAWKELDREEKGIYDTVWWKVIEEREYIQKKKYELYQRHIITMNEEYAKTIKTLDSIENERVIQTKLFKDLLEHSLRMNIKFSLYMRLFPAAEKMLQRYHNIMDVTGDWIFYYFRYQCRLAAYLESLRARREESLLRRMRKEKNEDRLKAVLLRYGRESYEFKFVFEKIRLEELGKPQANKY